jgi:thymidylate synthase (FAD)
MNVDLLDHMGTDLTVVNAARVSFSKHKDVFDEDDAKLIRYLAKHGHWTPFAHPQVSFRVHVPFFVARQLFKHKVGGVENEVSRRYVSDAPEFYYPTAWRSRPANIKQGSGVHLHPGDGFLADATYETAMRDATKAYQALLKRGVAPEMARMVLPQSTYTTWIWTASLSFWARVCKLRQDKDAQEETRMAVADIDRHCGDLFPVSWEALTK